MLSLRNISKSFIQRGIVLDNLCLEVTEGETIAVMGPSGSGKTTLMNIAGLLDKPDSGEILFRGSLTGKFTENESANYRNRNVGFVFQENLLLPYLTVSDNIFLPLLASGYSRDQLEVRAQYILTLMEKTGITNLRDKFPLQISGGEAQRVSLIRALANSPSLLLADEPTGSLDAKNAENLGDLLLEMNRQFGITIILATHSKDLAGKMSRLLHIENGKLI